MDSFSMQSHALYPPASLALREDIIGSVTQRKLPMRHSYMAEISGRVPGTNELPPPNECVLPSEPPKVNLSMREITAVADPSTLKTLHMLQQLKRERRRVAQQKYMKKKSRADADLEKYIPLLRDEVKQLKVQRDRLLNPKKTLWLAAVEYFRIFEHGVSGPETLRAKDLEFLRSMVSPDVDLGSATGFESILTTWRTFTQFFPDISVQLTSLKQITKDFLVASTTTRITMTKQSLHNAFPHLVDGPGDEKPRRKRIVSQLQGQRIVMTDSVRFGWGSGSRRVTKLYASVDMVSPLLQIVGSLEDVSIIFRGALITPDCNLVATTQKSPRSWTTDDSTCAFRRD